MGGKQIFFKRGEALCPVGTAKATVGMQSDFDPKMFQKLELLTSRQDFRVNSIKFSFLKHFRIVVIGELREFLKNNKN
jgi:hypothetical protein